MSLFSPASAAPQQNAAFMSGLIQTSLAGAQQNTLTDYANKAIGTLGPAYDSARGALTSNFAPALSAVNAGYDAARPDVMSNYQTGLGQINRGIAGYDPYVGTGTAANTMLSNALGLGGAGGNAAATAAFQAGPQYQWNLDQATGNAVRGANRYGMSTGGNTLDAITRLGSNLASGEYNNWLGNLNTMAGRGLSAASGQGGLLSTSGQLSANLGNNLGNLDTGRGNAVGNLYTNLGSGLGSLFANQGTNTANIYTGLGSGIAGVQGNLATALTGDLSRASDATAAADTANRKFQTGLLGTGLQLGAGLLSGGSGLGLSGLGGLGSGLGIGGGAGLSGLFSGFGGGTLSGGLGGSTLDPAYSFASSYG
jgi:hypothetical protein